MQSGSEPTTPNKASSGRLLRVLGLGFGLAVTVGGTIGLGILRNPGDVAGQLPNAWLILGVWVVGGVYALLGALTIAELGTLVPRSGGFYVFARRAYGPYPSFVIGWSDWLATCGSSAAAAIAIGEYAGGLVPQLKGNELILTLAVVIVFALINWRGVRWGSWTQGLTSTIKAIAFLGLVVACFVFASRNSAPNSTPPPLPGGMPFLAALMTALAAVIYTYDGWYGPIYFGEEVREPGRTVPRAMVGGVLLVTGIYLLVNLAMLVVLPMEVFAGETLAFRAAAGIVFGTHGELVIGILAIVTLLSLMSACNLIAPRILYAMGADGLFVRQASGVNPGGTPALALGLSTTAALGFILSGFILSDTVEKASGPVERVVTILAFFMVLNYTSAYIAVFVLRRREPDAVRPYRAWGYPWLTLLVLASSLAFLIGAIVSDVLNRTWNSLWALALLALSCPIFLLIRSLVRRDRKGGQTG